MKTIAMLSAAVLALAAPAAFAAPTVTFVGGSGEMPAGATIIENFDGYAPNSSIGTEAFAFSTKGRRPLYGSTGNFAALRAGGSYSVDFAPATLFSFVIGSVDSYNTLTLLLSDNSNVTYTGGEIIGKLATISGANDALRNGLVTFNASGGPKIIGATFASTGNSFEFDNLAAAVPEPSTWAMMIFGFGAIAGAMRHRRRAARALA
ncbi:PEPxxWA-CTERM sorting domain-containing protein [Sphingomonas sp. MMSM20]|uniref:PEPxxWA-CTERM sorting domain-containing protein n=1 Tax=Sphingomonas lycopersici TaxID=2951807 RepID=UPI0022386370|nr:PEPxxWA-CTERM sorting domain-containing protein [Sphingomonas lycopersici]MCW6532358.1 PEPxxWA-CTERM sorting domain-containing protein [Sphingomonas lycopersici]